MVSYIRAPEKKEKCEKGKKQRKRKETKEKKEIKTNITCAQGAGRVPKEQGYGYRLLVCGHIPGTTDCCRPVRTEMVHAITKARWVLFIALCGGRTKQGSVPL